VGADQILTGSRENAKHAKSAQNLFLSNPPSISHALTGRSELAIRRERFVRKKVFALFAAFAFPYTMGRYYTIEQASSNASRGWRGRTCDGSP
jgi:hypothetical protein